MQPLRVAKGLTLACLVTACATDAPIRLDTQAAMTAGFGGDPYGYPAPDANVPASVGYPPPIGATATGGVWGAGLPGTGGTPPFGATNGGAGPVPPSPGGGATGGANSGTWFGSTGGAPACPLPFLCPTGGAGGAAGAADPSGSAGSGAVGGAGFCDNATCFDVFDCWLYFPDKTSCKFTKCEGLLCKP